MLYLEVWGIGSAQVEHLSYNGAPPISVVFLYNNQNASVWLMTAVEYLPCPTDLLVFPILPVFVSSTVNVALLKCNTEYFIFYFIYFLWSVASTNPLAISNRFPISGETGCIDFEYTLQ